MNAVTTTPVVSARRLHSFHLRLPAVLLWLLLLPFAPLLSLALLIVCAIYGVNFFRAATALFRLFVSLKGTHVEVRDSQVSIVVSLF